jgi:DNA-directed RNA polymerase specialized sigma24 family protein
MEYTDIIHNLLAEPEHIKQCLDTISKLESTISSQVELLHLTRHITLEKIDFDTKSNSSDTLKEILKELECPTNKTSDTDDSILSLKISSILDSFIQNLSANDRNIYIFRYFFGYSIDNISSLCNCSTNNIRKVLSATNSMVITELKNAGIQYTTKTLLNSFGDIDDKHLISTVNNESN